MCLDLKYAQNGECHEITEKRGLSFDGLFVIHVIFNLWVNLNTFDFVLVFWWRFWYLLGSFRFINNWILFSFGLFNIWKF